MACGSRSLAEVLSACPDLRARREFRLRVSLIFYYFYVVRRNIKYLFRTNRIGLSTWLHSIILLGPGKPSQAKRVYRDEVRADLRRSYRTDMMEDFRVNIPLDDKFSKLISGRNLIAA